MSNPKLSPSLFFSLFRTPSPRRLFYLSVLALATLYPGHNSLQTQVLSPQPLRSYTLPSPSFAPYPLWDLTPAPPVTATSYIVIDQESKTVLAERRADVPLPPASITKLMTALVSLDTWPDRSTVLTVKSEAAALGATIELQPNEQLTVDALLHGLLIQSGNDAALTLADNYPGGYSAFVTAMNQKAQAFNLSHTVYKNPSGIDQYGHVTTARDIAILGSYALVDPYLHSVVTQSRAVITDVTGRLTHPLESTDELLETLPGLLGGKTGWTTAAGECFVSYVVRDDRGLITVVLGSTNRFADTTALVEWVYAHHRWTTVDVTP